MVGGRMMPGLKQNKAFVVITWPGGSASRTLKGNMTIRLTMEWCYAFNQLPGT
jgi:hypothetical protein